jgi:hypothetical protein
VASTEPSARSLIAAVESATRTVPSGSCRKANADEPGKPVANGAFCLFVLVLKLCTVVPSDVYNSVF